MVNINLIKIAIFCILFVWPSVTQLDLAYLVDIGNPGARYPVADIYDGKNLSDSLKGQLNTVGMRQQYLLGTYIRADYIDKSELLPKVFNPKTMEVFISSVDRSAISAASRMYGFYPIGFGWKIPDEVSADKLEPPFQTNVTFGLRSQDSQFALENGFTPVPLTIKDDVLNPSCPNLGVIKTKRLQQISKNLTSFQAQFSTYMAKFKLMFNLSTLEMNIPKMADLYDTIMSDYTLGKDIPQSFDELDMKALKYISDYYNTMLFNSNYGNTVGTMLLTEVYIPLSRAINQPSRKKYSAFFPLQPTLYSVMNLLNLTSTDCLTQKYKNQTVTSLNCMNTPQFSANLQIELHSDQSFQYFVKVKYNGQYAYLCQQKKYQCKFDQFWNRIFSVISRQAFQKDCFGK